MASFVLPCLTCIFQASFSFSSFFLQCLKELIHLSDFSFHFHVSISNLYLSLLLCPTKFQMIFALEVPTLLVHPHGHLHMFKTKLTISRSILTCISPCSSREADVYCESSVWIHYRELFLCSFGCLLSSLSMAVISESKAGADIHGMSRREDGCYGGGRLSGRNQNTQVEPHEEEPDSCKSMWLFGPR